MADDTRYRSDDPREPERSEPSLDPLTELARLIGNDPFADLRARHASGTLDSGNTRAAPEWLARAREAQPQDPNDESGYPSYEQQPYGAPRARSADYAADYSADYAPADDQSQAGDGRYADQRYEQQYDDTRQPAYADPQYADQQYEATEGDYDNPYHVAPPASEDADDGYYEGHLPPREDEGMLSGGRRGGLVTILAVLGLAVVGTAGAFGYRAITGGATDAPPPVIKADPAPVKSPPPTSADAQNKPIQDRLNGATVQTERIVTNEEQPVALPSQAAPRAAAPPPPVSAWPTQPAAPAAPQAGSPDQPKRVRTVTIRQDANTDPAAKAPMQAPQAAPTTTQTAPRAAAPKQQSANAPLTLAPQSDPAPAAAPRTAATGSYAVQVSAQRSEADAMSSYRSLQQKYPSVLGGREPNISRADLGDKGIYYRAQIGPFGTVQEARDFCASLKSAGGQCIVQNN